MTFNEVWVIAIGWLEEHFSLLYAVAMAIIVSYLRIMYTGKSKNKTAEVLLSGAITAAVYSALEWLGIPPQVGAFIGGGIGFVGVDFLRDKLQQLIGSYKEKQ